MKTLLSAATLFTLSGMDVQAGEPFRYSYRYGGPQTSWRNHSSGTHSWNYNGPGGSWSGTSPRMGNTTFHYGYGVGSDFSGTTYDYGNRCVC
ncbi:hypothetical protein CA54_17120 [Symmachiella macrocystis]|uniref:Uncharacterized protein n=1 Tax=Symmachiella macrocystis TaxID=2527985 RepID=A0A5C6BNJ4_9PLAN|nr:hypothetical protein CA54_17120 [Symmachiella macrocystis]